MASQQVAGAQAKGVYAFMKHFALNDQETNRLSELATWANEQSIREIYLKPFEMSVKQGGAGAVMSAFNYIGMEWGGSHSGLLNTVLRGEWGFRGMVLTIMNCRCRIGRRFRWRTPRRRCSAQATRNYMPHGMRWHALGPRG